jgi:prevent-host-death family protein
MDEISIDKARKKLGDIVDRARFTGQATVITRHGKPAATVAPILSDGVRRDIAQARTLAKCIGYDSEAGAAISDLLDIIGRLTADMHEETGLGLGGWSPPKDMAGNWT